MYKHTEVFNIYQSIFSQSLLFVEKVRRSAWPFSSFLILSELSTKITLSEMYNPAVYQKRPSEIVSGDSYENESNI